jgi:hypothetical protein
MRTGFIMKIFNIIAAFVILSTNSFPQNIWTKLNGPPGGTITGLSAKGDTLLAGTGIYKGMIYYSTNRGSQWHEADLRTAERVADFTYTDDGGFIAAGRKDGLFKSYDLLSWTKLSPEGQISGVWGGISLETYMRAQIMEEYGNIQDQ